MANVVLVLARSKWVRATGLSAFLGEQPERANVDVGIGKRRGQGQECSSGKGDAAGAPVRCSQGVPPPVARDQSWLRALVPRCHLPNWQVTRRAKAALRGKGQLVRMSRSALLFIQMPLPKIAAGGH